MAATVLHAQPTGIKRPLLMKKELADRRPRGVSRERRGRPGRGRECRPPLPRRPRGGLRAGGHGILEVEGQPPIELKPGDHYHIDASKRQDARNTGAAPAKGKPLAVAAP
jgi:hypothetical protein